MKAQHTPGPWMAIESQPGVHWIDIRETIGGAIATVWNDYEGANSRLIAAAPELLEALETLLVREGEHPDFEDDADGCDLVVTVGDIRKARAAIAKARGKQ